MGNFYPLWICLVFENGLKSYTAKSEMGKKKKKKHTYTTKAEYTPFFFNESLRILNFYTIK